MLTRGKAADLLYAACWGTGLLTWFILGIGVQQAVCLVRVPHSSDRLPTAIATLANSRGADVAPALAGLAELPREETLAALNGAFTAPANSGRRKLAFAYALAQFGQVHRQFLVDAIPSASGDEVDNLATARTRMIARRRSTTCVEPRSRPRPSRIGSSRHAWPRSLCTCTTRRSRRKCCRPSHLPCQILRRLVARNRTGTDPPLDPNWTRVDDTTRSGFAAAHGMLTDRFAYCLDMPWPGFLAAIESLRPSGYRPRRVRPYVHNSQRLVAAVWTRDSARWKLETDLTAKDLPAPEANAEEGGLLAADVSAYPGEGAETLYWRSLAASRHRR